MSNPKDASSFPSVIDLMRMRPQMSGSAVIADQTPGIFARLRHRFRMVAVFCELLFADVRGPEKR